MTAVRMSPDGVPVEVREGETILRALARAGQAQRVGCRRGGCGICKVDLLEGEVAYEAVVAPSVLSEEEKDAGVCLSCRAVPLRDTTVALRDDAPPAASWLLRLREEHEHARRRPPAPHQHHEHHHQQQHHQQSSTRIAADAGAGTNQKGA
ncbi:2Fe-2S iron-sulfur cluster-binding protein [Nocardioides sp. GY 10127]|uniref:2Fe-2S iron-sulfur cluster-binding protein n=1 Tax=Nocardioides sp. GY 10127 TaxID=2569762 RepID=UPI00198220D7|nr:2Fe-2S iron-sulfur cluster-binding protein [Nocardioides sp. GY 10127]